MKGGTTHTLWVTDTWYIEFLKNKCTLQEVSYLFNAHQNNVNYLLFKVIGPRITNLQIMWTAKWTKSKSIQD